MDPVEVGDLQHLRKIFNDSPTRQVGDSKWVRVKLRGASIMECTTLERHWAAVQFAGMQIGEQPVVLSTTLHAHITLGKWKTNNEKWPLRLQKARDKLCEDVDWSCDMMLN